MSSFLKFSNLFPPCDIGGSGGQTNAVGDDEGHALENEHVRSKSNGSKYKRYMYLCLKITSERRIEISLALLTL